MQDGTLLAGVLLDSVPCAGKYPSQFACFSARQLLVPGILLRERVTRHKEAKRGLEVFHDGTSHRA